MKLGNLGGDLSADRIIEGLEPTPSEKEATDVHREELVCLLEENNKLLRLMLEHLRLVTDTQFDYDVKEI